VVDEARESEGPPDLLLRLFGEDDDRVVRAGRVAAVAFIASGLAAIPANFLIEPSDQLVYLMPLFALVPGVVCLLVPWNRVQMSALHVISVLAIAVISLATAVASPAYAIYYVYLVLFAALVVADFRAAIRYWILITIGLLVPVVVGSFTGRQALIVAVLAAPTLLLLTVIAAHMSAVLEARSEALRALAGEDELTGVGNYRSFHQRLEAEIAQHSRSGREFALILLDLDSFKVVNDRFGHLAGDQVLAEVGKSLREGVRGGDSVFRQGGDEFSVIAPESGLAEAEEVAARLLIRLRECGVRDLPVTATAGIAVYPVDGETVDDLLGSADVRLLGTKHQAREAFGPPPGPPDEL